MDDQDNADDEVDDPKSVRVVGATLRSLGKLPESSKSHQPVQAQDDDWNTKDIVQEVSGQLAYHVNQKLTRRYVAGSK